MTGMKPEDAIGLKEIPLIENYQPEETLPEDRLYHYLLQPGENMTTSTREPLIEHVLRRLTD